MNTIWKFPLQMTHEQTVSMPAGAEIKHTGYKDKILCLWALVDPREEQTEKTIRIYATGQEITNITELLYLGSVVSPCGNFVWHVFLDLKY